MLCLMSITENLENNRRGSHRGEKKKKTTAVYKKSNEEIAVDEKNDIFELIEKEELTTMTAVSDNTLVLTHVERVLSNKEIEKEIQKRRGR